jgi:LysM repeat protein
LKQAHQLLSKWHGNETLTPAESEKVEDMLAQLAGTVIYSTEHQLEPARIVKPGETLETIAREYNVPWQLLGKINSVPAPDQVRPGQQLKVLRGPFTATVDLHRNELTLEVDGRYAGTFPVAVPPGATIAEGQWLVEQKTGATAGGVTPAAYPAVPAAADQSIVLRSAGAAASPNAPTLMITSSLAPAAPGSAPTALRVSAQDASDLSDILSIGSRVVVRR